MSLDGSSGAPSAGPRQYLLAQPLGNAVLVLDSADDHEALHMYSLPGIVMCVRGALLSADSVDADAAG
jgi:hypothetical protein